MSYHAKKRFGQNFLKSENILDKIVTLVNPQKDENIIEIGPGLGALTEKLANSKASITAVEYDRDLIPKLLNKFKNSNVKIIQQDILKYKPEIEKFKLAGNIPYNITTPIIDWLIKYHSSLTYAVLMVQKEMALRLGGKPASKNWSPLSIFTQMYFDVEISFHVNPENFQPPPKVTSTVIKLIPHEITQIENFNAFATVIRSSFKQRRKLLANNLMAELNLSRSTIEDIINSINLPLNCRAEQLTINDFLTLTEALNSRNIL